MCNLISYIYIFIYIYIFMLIVQLCAPKSFPSTALLASLSLASWRYRKLSQKRVRKLLQSNVVQNTWLRDQTGWLEGGPSKACTRSTNEHQEHVNCAALCSEIFSINSSASVSVIGQLAISKTQPKKGQKVAAKQRRSKHMAERSNHH